MDVRSAIQTIAVEHRRRYGYRRITAELRRRGMRVNHKRVASALHRKLSNNRPERTVRRWMVTTRHRKKAKNYTIAEPKEPIIGIDLHTRVARRPSSIGQKFETVRQLVAMSVGATMDRVDDVRNVWFSAWGRWFHNLNRKGCIDEIYTRDAHWPENVVIGAQELSESSLIP
jgi:HTH-like domain